MGNLKLSKFCKVNCKKKKASSLSIKKLGIFLFKHTLFYGNGNIIIFFLYFIRKKIKNFTLF